MKKWFFITIILLSFLPAIARHVAGGELFYEYLGTSNGSSTYRITLRLFRDCNSGGPLLENEQVYVGIYENNILIGQPVFMPLVTGVSSISLNTAAFPCLVGNVNVCYQIGLYTATVTLPDNQNGYTLSRLGCCRIDQISNLSQARNVGSNYVTKIPGKATLGNGHNNSPQFNVKDTALVCAFKRFSLDFGAVDKDNDSLTYSFCDAYATSSASGTSNNIQPTSVLNLIPLPYAAPYSGSYPLGPNVVINAATGIISGIAPGEGQYVVNVCITEWRNGDPFTQHRKDFILKVQNCDIIEASLPDRIIKCDNFTTHFENQSTSSSITSYLWNFGNPASSSNTSTDAAPDHVYTDTGRYIASLTITGPKGCVGTDSTVVIVYPGFNPGFAASGTCAINPYQFTDTTATRYGTVNSWRWDFGDAASDADTSHLQDPKYKYPSPGMRNVTLIVTSSKGCLDSLHKDVMILDKPVIDLPFKDTLICSIDSLPLQVLGTGTFSWQPAVDILNPNTANPVVFPKKTTQYIVTANLSGCINTDTVTVHVLDSITVRLNDSTVCTPDTFHLQPVSQALGYTWQASTAEKVSSIKYPLVQPLVNTVYTVIANLGHCKDTTSALIKAVPYPKAYAGADTSVCFNSRAQLHGTITGSSITWTPAAGLLNEKTLTPIAAPAKTTNYILTVTDTLGCIKPVSDTVTVIVIPPVRVNAGNDTSIVANQPLRLQPVVSGGTQFVWTPLLGINNPSVLDPVVILNEDIDSIRYKLTAFDQAGCYGSDEIMVYVFKTAPDLFIPSAFTPNDDGRNDIFRPVAAGISQLHYFRVYNRLGQLLFSTSELGKGWDGTYNGVKQPSGTYVFAAEGVDYKGKTVFRKGTCVLIR